MSTSITSGPGTTDRPGGTVAPESGSYADLAATGRQIPLGTPVDHGVDDSPNPAGPDAAGEYLSAQSGGKTGQNDYSGQGPETAAVDSTGV